MMNNENYYRNKKEIAGIEADALWKYHADTNLFVLVDNDQYKSVKGDQIEVFYAVMID